VIEYRLPEGAARRRAQAAAVVRAVTSLMPVVLAVVLLRRLGHAPNGWFWAVVAFLVVLVVVRSLVGYGTVRRRLAAMKITVEDASIRVDGPRDGWSIDRSRVARIVEIDGSLGGVRVESEPDPRSGVVFVVDVPRGGAGWADVRAAVEQWRPVERRSRRGPAVRLFMGALVVAGIFFLPFLLDDFVARSKLVAAGLVAATWIAMRLSLRGR
jgi:hypothetical protein